MGKKQKKQPRQPIHIGGNILKIPLVSLVLKSVILCLTGLTSNFLKKFFDKIPGLVNLPFSQKKEASVVSKNCPKC